MGTQIETINESLGLSFSFNLMLTKDKLTRVQIPSIACEVNSANRSSENESANSIVAIMIATVAKIGVCVLAFTLPKKDGSDLWFAIPYMTRETIMNRIKIVFAVAKMAMTLI